MRTTRQTGKAPSDHGRTTARKRQVRAKNQTNQKENKPPSLDNILEARRQIPSGPLTVVDEKNDKKAAHPLDKVTVAGNVRTGQAREEVTGDAHGDDLLQSYGSLESLAVLDGCLDVFLCSTEERQATHPPDESSTHQTSAEAGSRPQMENLLPHSAQGCSLDDCLEELEYEEVTCYEAEASSSTASKSYAVSNLVAEILERAEDDTKSSSEASSISCHNSPAKGAIFKSSKLAPHELQPKPASCHGNLKLHRFMMCEWFYSHIDSALFAEEHSRSVDFGTLLRQHYPALHRCPLQRPQWNRIRKEFGKVARVRRLSPAFLLQERITLERRREKVRFLMENPMIEYLDDDIPSIIPSRIEVGSKVRAALLSPNYGSFPGVVIGIENHDIPMFRVRFTIDGIDHEQLLPDYRVALDQSPPSPEQSDVLSVSAKHLRQVAALNECVDEKRRLLYELENIRLNVEARRAMGRINAERDQQQGQRYEQILRKLLDLNRTLLQLSKNVATEYEQNMSEQLTTSETPVVEAYVVEVVNQLIEDLSKLDQFHKNPEADRLWNEALERLGKNPEYLKQFGHYLASRIGNKFDPQAYRKQ
ncbi:uncharacterized protein LOC121599613 [Anopheles merus]|uniref:uncharacterized protein LOC121599613 n=1 Tax=Anopheles merus TaxID=30066 RepID=UPI001BE43663|nr:uncharacterized protein LOC121599613 [Anopheles merus]